LPCCFLDGAILPESEARIDPRDRGLLYSDGLFETYRTYRGRPFRLGEHWDRLVASARVLGITPPTVDPVALTARLLTANGLADAVVRVTLTRGREPVGPRPGPGFPTLLAQVRPLRAGLAELWERGCSGARLPWPLRARGLPLHSHKTLAYLPTVLALGAVGAGEEPILENTEGHVAEGATTNVFWVRQGRLCTPAVGAGCLPGVARRLALEEARGMGLPLEEGFFPWGELAAAAEAFLTNSAVEVLPLVRLGEAPVGDGRPGPVTRRLQAAYRERVAAEVGG
jgi:branched-subunit amino acid aminotransferase/4-amino-4-deoxychorismate lyase